MAGQMESEQKLNDEVTDIIIEDSRFTLALYPDPVFAR